MALCLYNRWHYFYAIDDTMFIQYMALCLYNRWHYIYTIDGTMFIQ